MARTLVLIAALVGVALIAQILLKAGMSRVGFLGMERLMVPMEWVPRVLSTPQILIAIPLFMVAFVLWMAVLSRADISVAYPLLSIAYVLIPFISYFVLGESISLKQWTGTLLISFGVVLVTSGR